MRSTWLARRSHPLPALRPFREPKGSNRPVERQVDRLKMLKRRMYRRVTFDFLRSRVLHAAA